MLPKCEPLEWITPVVVGNGVAGKDAELEGIPGGTVKWVDCEGWDGAGSDVVGCVSGG